MRLSGFKKILFWVIISTALCRAENLTHTPEEVERMIRSDSWPKASKGVGLLFKLPQPAQDELAVKLLGYKLSKNGFKPIGGTVEDLPTTLTRRLTDKYPEMEYIPVMRRLQELEYQPREESMMSYWITLENIRNQKNIKTWWEANKDKIEHYEDGTYRWKEKPIYMSDLVSNEISQLPDAYNKREESRALFRERVKKNSRVIATADGDIAKPPLLPKSSKRITKEVINESVEKKRSSHFTMWITLAVFLMLGFGYLALRVRKKTA